MHENYKAKDCLKCMVDMDIRVSMAGKGNLIVMHTDNLQDPVLVKSSILQVYDFHHKDKAVVSLPYLYNVNSYTGKTTSWYWHPLHP